MAAEPDARSSARGRDPSADPDGPPTFVTDDTHWWDGSQIYGRDPAFAEALRSGEHGKLRIDEHGLPPQDLEAARRPHRRRGQLLGRARAAALALHARAQRRLRPPARAHPELSDDELYDKARLVVAALMAKIHTTDWTPAIIAHPTTVTALRTNWWGLEGERLDKRIGRRTSNEVIRGIPGSPTNHHGVPYSLTEEFVCVYRMHPLIPDEFSFRSLANDALLQERTLPEIGALHVRERFARGADGRPALLVRHVASGRDHAAQLPALPPATSTAPTGRSSTSPRSTSCACASAACRATTSSAGCCT